MANIHEIEVRIDTTKRDEEMAEIVRRLELLLDCPINTDHEKRAIQRSLDWARELVDPPLTGEEEEHWRMWVEACVEAEMDDQPREYIAMELENTALVVKRECAKEQKEQMEEEESED